MSCKARSGGIRALLRPDHGLGKRAARSLRIRRGFSAVLANDAAVPRASPETGRKTPFMSDITTETARETGAVMTELVAKASEARAAGRSRRDFFASTAKLAGATALGAAGINLLQPLAARAATTGGTTSPSSSDTVQDILDIACTAEALAITFYYNALRHPKTLPDVNNAANRNYFQAALTEEYEHLLFLKSQGGKLLTNIFYFPYEMFDDEPTFFANASMLENYFISAYLAAALDFSGAYSSGITTASPTLIGVAVQIGGVECEHRVLLRVAQGPNPPNNVIAETAYVQSVQQAATALGPFLNGGAGFSSIKVQLPTASEIETTAGKYGPSSFAKPKYV
jgi:hypothetical protein